MLKRKKACFKRETEETDEHRWLITYADMITLLMVFFVVMYSIADVQLSKLNNLSFAFHKNFSSHIYFNEIPGIKGDGVYGTDGVTQQGAAGKNPSKEEKIEDMAEDFLNELSKELENELKDKELGKAVNIEMKEGELTISLNTGKGFFDIGSAHISPATGKVLDTIAKVCKNLPEESFVRVDGYTCDLPITSGRYPSNWELSTARATNVACYLIEKGKLNPEKFSAAGYGQYKPKYPNNSEENRAMNRRVDIIIVSNKVISF